MFGCFLSNLVSEPLQQKALAGEQDCLGRVQAYELLECTLCLLKKCIMHRTQPKYRHLEHWEHETMATSLLRHLIKKNEIPVEEYFSKAGVCVTACPLARE